MWRAFALAAAALAVGISLPRLCTAAESDVPRSPGGGRKYYQPTPDPPSPWGRQLVLGTLTATAAGVGGGFLVLQSPTAAVMGIVIGAPVLAGLVVCAVGSQSDALEGSCAASIGGAYVGMLLAIPGLALGALVSGPGVVVGGFVGYTMGIGVGATVGWNLSKTPKRQRWVRPSTSPAPAPAFDLAAGALPNRRGPLEARAALELVLPLVAVSF